jgi:SnoaL-like domain
VSIRGPAVRHSCAAAFQAPARGTAGHLPDLPEGYAASTGEELLRADLTEEAIRLALAFEGPLKGSSTWNKQLSIRFVGRDGAIVVSESGILFAGQTEVPDTGKVNATWVFEKRDGQWLIAAYHNSPMLAPGP